MKVSGLIYLFTIAFSIGAIGQQKEGANWLMGGYFDHTTLTAKPGMHLDFNTRKPTAGPFFYDHYNGGLASVSDKKGQLLFFSNDGHVASRLIINNKYQEMPNGDVFGSLDPGTLFELIIQDPSDELVYYIFFIAGRKAVQYRNLYAAKIDMRLNNGYGDVVPNSLQLLSRKAGLNLNAMLHTNNRDTWLVTNNMAGDTTQARLITLTGISAPVISATKNLVPDCIFKSSPNSELLAGRSNMGRTEVLGFNRATGIFSPLYSILLPNSISNREIPNAFAFSPDNSKLYVQTIWNPNPVSSGRSIVQYNLAAGSIHQIQQSAIILSSRSGSSGYSDLQLAIDGKIYSTFSDSLGSFSVFNYPDQPGLASNFDPSAFNIRSLGLAPGLIFPSRNQTLFRNAGILQAQALKDTICIGQSMQLSAYGAGAERFRWQPANGLSAPSDTLPDPVVWPTATTRYFITASSPFRSDTASFKVVVIPKMTLIITGPVSVSSQMQGVWYKAQNPQKLPITWGVSGGAISTNLTDSIRVQWGDTTTKARVWATVKAPAGCPGSSDTLHVKVKIAPKPEFYNIITPNNDQRNDAFVIENLVHYPQNKLDIYNRWGKRVYQANNYQNNWKAEDLSSGVYYYFFTANGQSWKGWVEVVK